MKYVLAVAGCFIVCFLGLWMTGNDFERGAGMFFTFYLASVFSFAACAVINVNKL